MPTMRRERPLPLGLASTGCGPVHGPSEPGERRGQTDKGSVTADAQLDSLTVDTSSIHFYAFERPTAPLHALLYPDGFESNQPETNRDEVRSLETKTRHGHER